MRGSALGHLQVVGELSYYAGGSAIPARFRSKTALELLTILALRAGEEISRDWVEEALWPESDGDRRAQNLRRALADIRSALDLNLKDSTPLQVKRSTLSLAPNTIEIDAFAPGLPLESAGLFLVGLSRPWSVSARNEFEQHLINRLVLVRQAARTEPEWGALREDSHKLIRAYPYRAAPREILIECCARLGQRADAIKYFEELAEMLDDEFGELPSAAALGALNLEPLFTTLQHETKAFSTYAIGRADQVHAVLNHVTDLASGYWITFTGAPGMGKTAMCRAVLDSLSSSYNCVLVPLSEAVSASQVSGMIAAAANLVLASPSVEKICASLSSDKYLIVLDNAEHLLPDLLPAIEDLARVPSVRLLVTSRIPCGSAKEISFPILPVSLHQDQLNVLIRYAPDSMRSLLETDPNSAAALDELASLLEGHPLSMQLAASMLEEFSIFELVTLIRESRRAKVGWTPTFDEAIRWSYDALPPESQLAFRAAALFAGEFSVDELKGAAGVQGEEFIDILLRHSLLTPTSDGLRMLYALRDLALAVSNADDQLLFAHNLCRYYRETLRRRRPQIDGELFEAELTWFASIEVNVLNLLRTLSSDSEAFEDVAHIVFDGYLCAHALTRRKEWASVVYSIRTPSEKSPSLAIFAHTRAHFAVFELSFDTAAKCCSDLEGLFEGCHVTDQVSAKLVPILLRIIREQDPLMSYQQCLNALLELERAHPSLEDGNFWDAASVTIRIHHFKGVVYRILNQPQNALSSYLVGFEIAKANHMLRTLAPQLHSIADVMLDMNDLEQAHTYLTEALGHYQRRAPVQNFPHLLETLGFLECKLGNYESAVAIAYTIGLPNHDSLSEYRSRLLLTAAILLPFDLNRAHECFRLHTCFLLDHTVAGPFVRNYFPEGWFDEEPTPPQSTVLIKVQLMNHLRHATRLLERSSAGVAVGK